MITSFLIGGNLPAYVEAGTYNLNLVVLSYVVASFASYTALLLAKQLRDNGGALKSGYIVRGCGAFALGAGIWSMHFIGMLAYKMQMEVEYDPLLTILSLLVAIFTSYGVLLMMGRQELSLRQVACSAVLLGAGISAMHYIGMASMKMDADLYYKPLVFIVSIFIAMTASALALWVSLALERYSGRLRYLFQIGAALVMGAAICGMHYTGMAAAVFSPYAQCRYNPNQSFDTLAISIAIITGIILLLALISEAYQRRSVQVGGLFSAGRAAIGVFLLFGGLLSFMLHQKIENDYNVALESYRQASSYKAREMASRVNQTLQDIYRGLATISLLPSVRRIGRHGEGLDEDTRENIQLIYDNLKVETGISEVYIVPVDMDPDAMDHVTHKLQEPIIMFDSLITEKSFGEETQGLEEVEIHEYRQLRETEIWLKQHYPVNNSIKKATLPIIGGPAIITCDNRFYKYSRSDKDRTGIILSVPFWGQDGKLKGSISGIILESALRGIFPSHDYALINKGYNISISQSNIIADEPNQWKAQSRPDPHLLYSAVLPILLNDPRSPWTLWVGFPNDGFLNSSDIKSLRRFERIGYGFILLLTLTGIAITVLMQRHFRLAHASNEELITRLEIERSQKETLVAKELAEQANAAKSEFLANMSHELRTPLNSILGMTRLLKEAPLDKDHHELAETAFRSSVNLLDIVNDILDLSKVEAGELQLERIGMDLSYILHGVVHTLEHLAREKHLQITNHCENQVFPYVLGDPARLSQVLINLIGNAIKYTDEGRVDVYAALENVDKNHVTFTCKIADTGIGIPKEKHDIIFEKFSQADASTTRRYGGTGLGLTITRSLVELMGGTIGLESAVGKGSVFFVKIPFEVTDRLNEEKRLRREKMSSGTISPDAARVLVVEDHPANQFLIEKFLERFGIKHFETAENGAEAINLYKEKAWDVILMDCHMPVKNGYDATKEIRALEKGKKHTPIVAMTANAMVGDREKCLRYGMDEYISKPIAIDELKQVLGQWIRFGDVGHISQESLPEDGADLPIDIAQLRGFTGGDTDIEKKLMGLFIDRSEKNIEILARSRRSGESAIWKETAHTLKGGAGSIGAIYLCHLCNEAQNLDDAEGKKRAASFEKIRIEYQRVKDYIKKMGWLP